ncbi:lipopolysaccharide biosynthesis protein [Bacteroides xylanisolvens]|nr:lipopolysaccharide biosynthesis protein [Bacteroides xylanisolvens]
MIIVKMDLPEKFQSHNKVIAKNTFLLYIRMLFLILVQLYTVPIILRTLGVEDYGIYNVVGGIVSMFSFIGSSLASGSQRFIAFALGKGNKKDLIEVFNTTVTIYYIIGIISFLVLELLGGWFLNFKMNIPVDRLEAANWTFQLSLLAFLISLTSIPYNSAIIAHEKMSLFAYLALLECGMKLIIAISLPLFLCDHLIVYSLFLCIVTVIIRVVYQVYCHRYFVECRKLSLCFNSLLRKKMISYTSWNMIGSIALILRQQGLNIVLNLFFGPFLNAAHSIAQQLNGVLTQFVNNIYVASRPQITKLYATQQIDSMWVLVIKSSKMSFFLLTYLSIPAFIELDSILKLWLKDVPAYTVAITRLFIATVLIETLVNQLIGVFQAANKLKIYQIFSSTILLLIIPISYVLLLIFPDNPLLPYWVSLIVSIFYISSIMCVSKIQLNLDCGDYFYKVILKSVIGFAISFVCVYLCIYRIEASLLRVAITVIISSIIVTISVWTIGLEASERKLVRDIIGRKCLYKWKNQKL